MKSRQQFTVVGNSGATSVELQKGSLLAFGPDETDVEIDVAKGKLWVTAEGDPNDQVLTAGEHGHLRGKRLVAEALADSEISVA